MTLKLKTVVKVRYTITLMFVHNKDGISGICMSWTVFTVLMKSDKVIYQNPSGRLKYLVDHTKLLKMNIGNKGTVCLRIQLHYSVYPQT